MIFHSAFYWIILLSNFGLFILIGSRFCVDKIIKSFHHFFGQWIFEFSIDIGSFRWWWKRNSEIRVCLALLLGLVVWISEGTYRFFCAWERSQFQFWRYFEVIWWNTVFALRFNFQGLDFWILHEVLCNASNVLLWICSSFWLLFLRVIRAGKRWTLLKQFDFLAQAKVRHRILNGRIKPKCTWKWFMTHDDFFVTCLRVLTSIAHRAFWFWDLIIDEGVPLD